MSQELSADAIREIEKLALKTAEQITSTVVQHVKDTLRNVGMQMDRTTAMANDQMAVAAGLHIRAATSAIDSAAKSAAEKPTVTAPPTQ